MSDTVLNNVLSEFQLPGFDVADALVRFGNNPKLYVRIINSFVNSMPGLMEELATDNLSAENLQEYAIKIHGAKGSCYGVGAVAVGDKAKELEISAKAGDYQACIQNNNDFLQAAEALLEELKGLLESISQAEAALNAQPELAERPDSEKLENLLTATKCFDIDRMGTLVEELRATSYVVDGEVINTIYRSFEAFDYQAIEEAITQYLLLRASQ